MDKIQALLKMCFMINTQGKYTATFDLTQYNQILISLVTVTKIDLKTIVINENDHTKAIEAIDELKPFLENKLIKNS